jgi:hypothetical protein
MSKKKFNETKVGKFILKKLPGFISGALPEKGVLGVVKNLIDNDPAITPEEKAQMHKELVELYELEVADRDSARKREVEKAKTGQFDFMFNLTGVVGLGAFAFLVYAIVYLDSSRVGSITKSLSKTNPASVKTSSIRSAIV